MAKSKKIYLDLCCGKLAIKRLIPILFLLIFTSRVGYADQWLVGKDREPKEAHVGELIIIEGCRGEFCFKFCDDRLCIHIPRAWDASSSYWFELLTTEGFSGWWESEKPIGLKTSRPFTLYSDLDGPTPIKRYDAGVIAKPLEQKIVIRDRGEYVIEKVIKPDAPLKAGDKVDTPIYVGEGFFIVRSNGRWTDFEGPPDIDDCLRTGDCNEFKLKDIREAKVEYWIKVEVEGVVGFTPEGGFLQGCWE